MFLDDEIFTTVTEQTAAKVPAHLIKASVTSLCMSKIAKDTGNIGYLKATDKVRSLWSLAVERLQKAGNTRLKPYLFLSSK